VRMNQIPVTIREWYASLYVESIPRAIGQFE
jgi:hypothetical protein